MPQVMTGDDMQRVIKRISHEILETHSGAEDVILVGIHTRGVPLAEKLAETVESFEGLQVPVGTLDIGLYRDDRDRREQRNDGETHIPEDISDKHVVIVDDVLYTGRTIRSALDALTDLGRAATVEVAVMVDRGHRELPIRADYVGKNIPTSQQERITVRTRPVDDTDGVWVEVTG